MKFKESGEPFTAEELAKMVVQDGGACVPYDGQALRLYRKFVREFLGSEKIKRSERTGQVWFVDKKLKHVWKRYCDDEAYVDIEVPVKRQIMAKALFDATGIHHPLEGVNIEEDYAKRMGEGTIAGYNPGLAATVAQGLKDALKDKATFGVYKLVKIAGHLRDGVRRRSVAERYAEQFRGTGMGTDDLTYLMIKGMDDDGALGVAASLIAMKLDRFTRREATLLAAQTLCVAGNALTPVPIASQAVGIASTALGSTVKAEEIIRNLAKRFEGNLGIARQTAAFSLWGLGNRSHTPTLEFMVEMGLLDAEGYLRSGGFFDHNQMRLATNFIGDEIKSTGR